MPQIEDVPPSTPLQTILLEELKRSGPLPFAWFMERALYDPEHGFYAGGKRRTGAGADFVTAATLTPALGGVIAVLARNCWKALGSPARYVFMEQGAGDGSFAAAFLGSISDPEFRAALEYRIIEPFPRVRALQEPRLGKEAVHWEEALPQPGSALEAGMHFSNELPDAMPVHLCKFRGGRWVEMAAAADAETVVLCEGGLPNAECLAFLENLPWVFAEGAMVEINLAMLGWIRDVAASLQRGHVLVLDYGYGGVDRYDPRRVGGTLSGYRRQQRVSSLLEEPGETDLTSHVDFASLAAAGMAAGLQLVEFIEQHRFLVNAARDSLEQIAARSPAGIRFLAHPGSLGTAFKALLLSKDAPAPVPWSMENRSALERLGLRD